MLWTPAYMALCLETLSLPCRIWTINVHCTWMPGDLSWWKRLDFNLPFCRKEPISVSWTKCLSRAHIQKGWSGLWDVQQPVHSPTCSWSAAHLRQTSQIQLPHTSCWFWNIFNFVCPLCNKAVTSQKKKKRDLLEKPVLSISPEVRRKCEKSQLLRLDSSGLMLCNCSQRLV